ncbi:MAG: hypothetical protein SGILL_001154 [Bacillariaceae sp.]
MLKFTVTVAQKPSESEIETRQKEEQQVIEARIRAEQQNGTAEDSPKQTKKKSGAAVAPDSSPSSNRFGSELEKDERFQQLKKRTESFASNEEQGTRTPQKDAESIHSIAMTPEERDRLWSEMRAQNAHPLSLQVEAEAYQRRLQNEQAYNRSNSVGSGSRRAQRAADLFRSNSSSMSSASRRMRYRGGRDWNQIVEAFERNGGGEGNSLDDLVVLEAAMMLSMGEEANRDEEGGTQTGGSGGNPLIHSLLGGPSASSHRRRSNAGIPTTAAAGAASLAAASISETRRRNQVARAAGLGTSARSRGSTNAALDTASMMMRGISEEEQIAMAIAASLNEQNSTNNNETAETGNQQGGSSSSSSFESESEASLESESSSSSDSDAGSAAVAALTAGATVTSNRDETEHLAEAATISDLARVVTDSVRDADFGAAPSEGEDQSGGDAASAM